MTTTPNDSPTDSIKIYDRALQLFTQDYLKEDEVEITLINEGFDADVVHLEVNKIIDKLTKKKAQQEILLGTVVLFGGLMGTASKLGYIFWGAILFGLIRLFKGLLSLPQQDEMNNSSHFKKTYYSCDHCSYTNEDDFEYCPQCQKNNDGIT